MFHPISLVIPFLILLPNLAFIWLPPKNPPTQKAYLPFLKAAEALGRFGVIAVPLFYPDHLNNPYEIVSAVFMLATLLLYYWGWINYFRSDREYKRLLSPMLGIPVPMAVFPSLYFLLSSVVLHSVGLLLFAAMFAVGHVANSYTDYVRSKDA